MDRSESSRIRSPLRSPGRRRGGGFSLLEVLVVVAVIGLLVAILIPALSLTRNHSKRAVCASNLHQIAAAWHQYLDANGGRFFQSTSANYNYGGLQGNGGPEFGKDPRQPIPKPLNPFVKLKPVTREGGPVFLCPADTGGDVEKPTACAYYGTSYTTNTFLIGQERLNVVSADPCRSVMLKINKRLKGINRSSIWGESKLLLVGDFGWAHTYNFLSPVVIDWHGCRHTHNLAFMDGHVDFVRIRKGVHLGIGYTTIPFRDLMGEIAACQTEVTP